MKQTPAFRLAQTITGLLASVSLAVAGGMDPPGYRDYARVESVEPIVETSWKPVARQRCKDHTKLAAQFHPVAPTIGEDVRRQMRLARPPESCHSVVQSERQTRVTGYRVTYRYRGRKGRTRLSYDPGSLMPVDVNLSPFP